MCHHGSFSECLGKDQGITGVALRVFLCAAQLKKVLSSIPEAPLNVECLMNDVDFRSFMTREKFEELAAPILARAHGPIKQVSRQRLFCLHSSA